MKIFKPDSLGLLYRTMTLGRQSTMVFGLMALFRFDHASSADLMSEAELWKTSAKMLGANAALDHGMPKPSGEFMVYGAAFAPPGETASQLMVTATVGNLSKQLAVFGDRRFGMLKSASAPLPFDCMPMDPAHAFGGPGYADNPVGTGFVDGTAGNSSEGAIALPNVESPKQLIALEGDVAAPAGFWGWPPQAPQRTRHLGSVGAGWLSQGWPHLPEDVAPGFFHAAPDDQRFNSFLNGDERFEVVNMHPDKARVSGTLPALRARCLVHRRTAQGKEISELKVQAETLWLFPEIECGIVLYRASTRLDDEDADDLLHVMAEWESMRETPQSFEHYRDLFQQQIDGKGAVEVAAGNSPPALEEPAASAASPLASMGVPLAAVAAGASVAIAPDPLIEEVRKKSEELEKLIAGMLDELGMTPADILPKKEKDNIPDIEEISNASAALQAKVQQMMEEHGIDLDSLPAKSATLSEQAMFDEMEKNQAAVRNILKQSNLEEADMDALIQSDPGLAGIKSGIKQLFHPPELDIGKLRRDYDAMAAATAALPVAAAAAFVTPQISPGEPPALPQLPSITSVRYADRAAVIEAHKRGVGFAGDDLSGIDLSGLDFSGVDFSGALLEKTDFSDARLARSRFDAALLQGAIFSDADLSAASLKGASAGATLFAKARMEGSDVSGTDFTAADFTATQLNNATMSGAVFDKASMAGLKARACRAGNASFSECDLSDVDFGAAYLVGAKFGASRCTNANMRDAICDKADFEGANYSNANFTGASLQRSRAGAGSFFDAAVFSRAQMTRASWEGASIYKAQFDQTVLDHANFSRTQAQGAIFSQASAKGATFSKADLSRADLSTINLFKGSLRKSKMEGTLMRNANLYGVDFEGTRPTVTSLEGSIIDQTILEFRKPVI